MRVYLAGPINGRSDAECNDWRAEAKRLLAKHDILDPMARDYRGVEDINVSDIVEGDKADIDSCDAILAHCDTPSVGTSMEILYAWDRGKPVVVVVPQGARVSPWLRYHSVGVATDLWSGIRAVEEFAR